MLVPVVAGMARAEELERLLGDRTLSPSERIARIRRIREEIDGELAHLIGTCDSYIGTLELQREAEAMRRVAAGVLVREDAEIREELEASGVTPEVLDQAGIANMDVLREAAADGTLEEALGAFGAALNPQLLARLARGRRRDKGRFAAEFGTPQAPKGRSGKALPGAKPPLRMQSQAPTPTPAAPRSAPTPRRQAPPKRTFDPDATRKAAPAPEGPPPDKPKPRPKAAVEPPERKTDEPIDVGADVNRAADLLAQGKKVRFDQPRTVSVLLDELHKRVQAAKNAGQAAPDIDLCKVSVKGTNLFCAESKGIPRVKMPQLSGIPQAGSRADREMEKDARGGVNLGPRFRQFLEENGALVSDGTSVASHLKASQIELNGAKVAGMVKALEAGRELPGALFVSADDYIVDGHHTWAARVGHGLGTEKGEATMPVQRVQMDIIELIESANRFAAEMGMPQAGVAQMRTGERGESEFDRLRKGELPENGDLYFNTDPAELAGKYGVGENQIQQVPLGKIKPIRARPEGIANAKPLMIKAALGEGGKRDPITLVTQPDGSYKVHDGNSTFAIASEAGWERIPAIVAESDEQAEQIEAAAKEAKAAGKAAQAQRAEIDAALKEMFTEDEAQPAQQNFGSIEELFEAAKEANPQFKTLLTEGLPEMLGATVPSFEEALDTATNNPGQAQVLMGPMKKMERAAQKVATKYDGDFNRLQDVVRATILVGAMGDIPAALDAIRARAEEAGWEIRAAENKFSDGPPPPWVKGPTDAGYSDAKVELIAPNGVAAELQFNTNAMFIAKEGQGHKLYEEQRAIEAEIKARRTPPPASPGTEGAAARVGPTADELSRLQTLKAEARQLYSAAREASYA